MRHGVADCRRRLTGPRERISYDNQRDRPLETLMLGQMMDRPLMISSIIEHAARNFSDHEVVSRTVEGEIHRYAYRDAARRSRQLAKALIRLGVKPGDRVATIAWNTYRHLEIYYAVSGIGAVCHTINPLLGPEQVAYVVNDAEDKLIFFDTTFAPIVDALAARFETVEGYVAMTGAGCEPDIHAAPHYCYEALLAAEDDDFQWPEFDENTASVLCYTSGTTGRPKGVLYSHRSQILHALCSSSGATLGVNPYDAMLPVVPMFHVNAWGVPYYGPLCGAKLVFPGPGVDGKSLWELMHAEKVTVSLGVPTIWLRLLEYMDAEDKTLPDMRCTVVGGAALTEAIVEGFEKKRGIMVIQGWGMTEMSPVGTFNLPPDDESIYAPEELLELKLMQGKEVPGMEMRVVDAQGHVLPRDGKTSGHLQVRSPWVLKSYFKDDKSALTADGWFDTGDIAYITPEGRMKITDRAKDLIKSGGEWISTIEIENAASNHPAVAMAAVIGAPHPKWQERPLLIIQLAPGSEDVDCDEILAYVKQRLPRLSHPDAVEIIDAMPLGATGKILKTKLREKFKDYVLPTIG